MTFRKTLEAKLVEHGLWPQEAEEVLKQQEDIIPSMKGRWDDETSGYPVSVLAVLWLGVKTQAIKHLKETKPMHFALMILEG